MTMPTLLFSLSESDFTVSQVPIYETKRFACHRKGKGPTATDVCHGKCSECRVQGSDLVVLAIMKTSVNMPLKLVKTRTVTIATHCKQGSFFCHVSETEHPSERSLSLEMFSAA